MAKKKVTHQEKPSQNPEKQTNQTAAAMEEASEKLESLKYLNAMLLKETVERRQQVDSLKQSNVSLESELTQFKMEKKELESDLAGLGDFAVLMELEWDLIFVFVGVQVGEQAEMIAKERAEFGREKMEIEIRLGSLEREMGELITEKSEIEKVKSENQSQIRLLKNKLSELVVEIKNEKDVSNQVTCERDEMRSERDIQIEETNGLKQKLIETERREKVILEEVEKLRVNYNNIVEEKEDRERKIESITKDKDAIERSIVELNWVIKGLKRETEEMGREKGAVEAERNAKVVKINELENSVTLLKDMVLTLQKEEEKLRGNVAGLEKKCGEWQEKENQMVMEINVLHNSDGVGEDQEAEKDMTAESLTDTKEEDEAQPMMSEESKDPNTTPIVNENTKPRDSEAADVDDPNTEEAQSETSNSQEKTLKKPDKILPCPRCNSMETKFCYYNNYNVNQPRHFCKNCQRYWTAGGTMRNVPVGAGRRKNKYSASQYRHVAVSEALQNARVDLPNGIHHPAQKTNGNVLTFGSDTPLCESMTSVLKISGKTMLNGSQNGFHKPEEVRIPVSYGPGEIVDDYSSGSSVTAPNSKDEVGKPGLQNPVIQSCQSFPPQLPCYPGAPWPYPWNTGQWNSPVTQVSPPGFCHPGFPMPFYSSAPYWGCNVPVPGPWNVHWLSPTNLSPSQAAPSSVPNSPTLGKHSRDETMPKSTGSFDEDSVKENNPEKCLWVPKTLRIDDPGEAAKSSIWATLGIKNERADVVSGGGLFKAFQSKENEKGHISNPSSVLHANPAAMSRSQSFREST